MRQFLLAFLLMCITFSCYSQEASPDTVYSIVQGMPEFTGGDVFAYARKSTTLDKAAQPGCHRIILSFIVDKNGNTTDIKFEHNENVTVSKQTREIITQMKWKPGRQDGEAVRVKYCIPMHIRVE